MSKKLIICITVLFFSGFIYAKGKFVSVGSPDYPDNISHILSIKGDLNGNIFFAYVEDSFYLSVAKFDGEKWSYAGERKFTGKIANFRELYDATDDLYVSFTISDSGVPYVAFSSYVTIPIGSDATGLFSVMKYDAGKNTWEFVGEPFASKHVAKWISISVNSKEVPYVTFSSCSSESCERINEDNLHYTIDTTSVMKFDGGDWVYVGEPMFNYDPEIYCESSGSQIIFDSADTPYVSFFAEMNLSLFKFNGSEWQIINNTEYSKESPVYLLPYMDSEDKFYYIIDDEFFKFDGKELTALEVTGEYYFPSAEIDGSDVIYSAISKSEDGEKRIQVKRFVDEKWENIGDEGYLVNGSVREFKITVDNNSLPYFAYMDPEGPKLVKYDPEAVETPDDPDDDTVSDEDTVVDENETADESINDGDTAVDENSTSDEETIIDVDSAPANDKDSGSSGCGILVM